MKTLDALVFSAENFEILKEEYARLNAMYKDRGFAMQDTADVVRSLYHPERKAMLRAEARYNRKFPSVVPLVDFLMAQDTEQIQKIADLTDSKIVLEKRLEEVCAKFERAKAALQKIYAEEGYDIGYLHFLSREALKEISE